MAKLITVCGATGRQGGGVVKALVAQPEAFIVRGVSRNIESEKAKKLKQIGEYKLSGGGGGGGLLLTNTSVSCSDLCVQSF